jgi:hypothetical protein
MAGKCPKFVHTQKPLGNDQKPLETLVEPWKTSETKAKVDWKVSKAPKTPKNTNFRSGKVEVKGELPSPSS